MNTTRIATENDTLTAILSSGVVLTYSAKTDRRVAGAEDGKLQTKSERGARELAGEMRAWGVSEARAFGHAVVFWG